MENKFRDKLYDMEGTPSSNVWAGIEKNLAKKTNNRNWIYISLSVIVISIGTYLGLSNNETKNTGLITNHQVITHNPDSKLTSVIPTIKEPEIKTDREVKGMPENITSTPKITKPVQQTLTNANETKPVQEITINPIVKTNVPIKVKVAETGSENLFPVLKIQIVSDIVPMYIDPMFRNLVVTFRNPEVENTVRENIYQIKGFHAGISGDFNSTNILNQNTYNEFKGKNLSTKLTYGKSLSLNFGYDFNSRIGIQMEGIMNAAKGQKFEDTYNGMPVSRDIAMKYDEVPVFVKFKMSTLSTWTKRPSVINFIAGLEYGYLVSANENLMGTVTDITNRFNHNDISMLTGLEYNLYFGHHFFFAGGLRCSYSLLDINAPGWKLDPGTGSTHNFIFGGNIGLNYLFN